VLIVLKEAILGDLLAEVKKIQATLSSQQVCVNPFHPHNLTLIHQQSMSNMEKRISEIDSQLVDLIEEVKSSTQQVQNSIHAIGSNKRSFKNFHEQDEECEIDTERGGRHLPPTPSNNNKRQKHNTGAMMALEMHGYDNIKSTVYIPLTKVRIQIQP
jgi:hypothetical protein